MKKTPLIIKETHKKNVFFLKIAVYLILLAFSASIIKWVQPYSSNIDNLLFSLQFFLGGNIIISLGRIIIVRIYLRKKEENSIHSNFVLGINRIASIINVVISIIALMFLFEIRPLEFLSSITIVAAAIALLTRDYIINMTNGLIIMFTDQISIGDHIKIGEHRGKIMDITLLNIILVNEDDDLVMIPNSLILTSQIINHSRQNIRKLTFEFEMKLQLQLDVNDLEQRLKAVLEPFAKEVVLATFVLKTIGIHKDSLHFKVQFQLNNQNREKEKMIKRKMNQSIIEIVTENG